MKAFKPSPRYASLAVLLALSAFVLVERLSVPRQPYGSDVMAYAVIGHELLEGRLLYSDLWDHKPPAVFITYAVAEVLAGYGPQMLLLLNVVATLLTLLGVYWAGRYFGEAAGLWAASLWAVLSGSHALEAREPNTEVFINACLVWAFALFARADARPLGAGRAVAAGCLLALGSFYKPVVVACAALLAVAHLLFRPRESKDRRGVLVDVLLMGLVGLAGWGALFGYFAATGRFAAFRDAMITYNRHYSGSPLLNIVAPLQGKGEVLPDFLTPLAVLAAVGAVLTLWLTRRAGALLIAYTIGAWIMIALPGQFYPHYYQLWLPPLALGAGCSVVMLTRVLGPAFRWLPHALAALLLVSFAFKELPFYRAARTGEWAGLVDPQHESAESVARQINTLLLPGETFFLWGGGAGPYFWSRRSPPTGVLYPHHMLEGPLAGQLSARVADDLSRERPELLAVSTRGASPPDWLTQDFIPLQTEDGGPAFKLYARRDGGLARRRGRF